ncbi:MAG: flagellar biosynthesis protein FlhF [Thermodesulfovibrionales bacterium]
MKIKRFKAKTFAEALEMVKKELSEEAVILSSEEKKGLRSYVEVTAAVDYDQWGGEEVKRLRGEGVTVHGSRFTDQGSSAPPIISSTPPFDEIKQEIEKIRGALEEMKFSGFEITLPENKRKIFHIVRSKGIKEEFTLRLCERAKGTEDLVEVIKGDISKTIKNHGERSGNQAIMLVGPTGVGKTTTIAKLAAQAIRKRKRPAIINLDTYRIGAPEQIRIYARILGIPLLTVSNARELTEGLKRFSEDRDIVFLDTTGRNPKDEGYINEIRTICSVISEDKGISSVFPLDLHLLMNTNSDSDCMIEAYKYYRTLPINHIAFTKVDEAVRFGNIYNMIMTYQRPVAYITTGQKVPDDIDFPGIDRIARLILNGREPEG